MTTKIDARDEPYPPQLRWAEKGEIPIGFVYSDGTLYSRSDAPTAITYDWDEVLTTELGTHLAIRPVVAVEDEFPSWHCDHYISSPTAPDCLRRFLLIERLPAVEKMLLQAVPLFAFLSTDAKTANGAIEEGTRVRVVMASRFGDVGITTKLRVEHGYMARVKVEDLNGFTDVMPVED